MEKRASKRFVEEVDILLRARYPMLYVVTHEEHRLENLLIEVTQQQSKTFYSWSSTEGMLKYDPQKKEFLKASSTHSDVSVDSAFSFIHKCKEPAVFYFKDFGLCMDCPQNYRKIKDLAHSLKSSFKSLVAVSTRLQLPPEIEKDVTLLELPLPDHQELLDLLKTVCEVVESKKASAVSLDDEGLITLARAAQGLTMEESENVFSKAVIQDSSIHSNTVKHVINEKRQIIKKSGVLEFYPSDTQIQDIGGLSQLKKWLELRRRVFLGSSAESAQLPIPKGVLLLGAPGSGKSLMSKAIAAEWRLPLLKLDFGKIFSGLVGSSEENMRKSLKLAESLSPVVLWIDEIEKGLAGGANGGNNDSGVAARVLGSFLTWMQEKNDRVFVVATANRIENLPPELLRKGRFDEIFFSDLPDANVRTDIFKIHLRKRNCKVETFDCEKFSSMTEGFSGSEIEQTVIEALYKAFHLNREVLPEDVEGCIRETVPLSVTYVEDLSRLREWCKYRARHAELPLSNNVVNSRFSKLEVKKA